MSHPFGSRPHAELGASSAHRWMGCPGSVRLAAGVAAPASTYAEEGAAAHTLAEICLEDSLDALALIGRELNGHIVDAEMADSVQVYLDAVRAELGPGDLLLVEQHFSLDQLDPPGEMFGTADAVVIKPALRRLVVFDLKYGAGVCGRGGRQPAGALLRAGRLHGGCRPPGDRGRDRHRAAAGAAPVRAHSPRDGLGLRAGGVVGGPARRSRAHPGARCAPAPLRPGEWCRFCPAAGVCPALRERALTTAQIEFAEAPLRWPPNPASLTAGEVGRLLTAAELVELWIRALRTHAHAELEAGRPVPGWKLVPKRATRRWRDEDTAPAQLQNLGLAEDELFARKLRSPAQVEKLLGSKRKREIAALVVAESGGATLAPAADPRPPITSGAAADFAALPPPVSQ